MQAITLHLSKGSHLRAEVLGEGMRLTHATLVGNTVHIITIDLTHNEMADLYRIWASQPKEGVLPLSDREFDQLEVEVVYPLRVTLHHSTGTAEKHLTLPAQELNFVFNLWISSQA